MTIPQRIFAVLVAIECVIVGVCAYMLGRTYAAVKGKHG